MCRKARAFPFRPSNYWPQARASWQWYNYSATQVPESKALLRVNMDETAICLFQGGGKGNVFVSKRDQTAVQNVPRGRTRTYLTHVAFVCDVPTLQARLPQVLIANTRTLRAADHAALAASLPPNFRLMRRNSAWTNELLTAQIVRLLRECLEDVVGEYQIILLFDALPAHTAPQVLRACEATGIWPVVVPAKATWLLQPLDTHVFLAYKVRLQKAYQEARLRTETGEIFLRELLPCIVLAVHQVFESREWAHAFNSDGFSLGQAAVSERVRSHLQLADAAAAPHVRPSLDQLSLCFPKRRVVPVAAIWRPYEPRPPHVGARLPASGLGAVGPVLPGPFARRASPRLAARAARRAALDSDAVLAGAPHVPSASGASSSSAGPALAIAGRAKALAKAVPDRVLTRSMTRSLREAGSHA